MTPAVHLVLLAAQLIFGANHVVAKGVMLHVPPLALAGLRVAVSTPLLLVVAWIRERAHPVRGDLPRLALLGLLGVTANQLLFLLGLRHSTATNASILMLSIPAFTTAVAALLRVERPTRLGALGVAVAMAGALVMLRPQRFSVGAGTLLGDLLLLGNCLCYSFYLVLQRPLLARIPWRTLVAWAFVGGALLTLPVTAPSLAQLAPSGLSARVLLGLAYVTLLATAVGYLLNTWAVLRSSPIVVAAYITLQPLVGGTLAALFLGERIRWQEGIAGALILAGLTLVSWRPRLASG